MNIYRINNEVDYQSADKDAINDAVNQMLQQHSMSTLLFDETRYLPSLHEKSKTLYTTLILARMKIREQATALGIYSLTATRKLNNLRERLKEAGNDGARRKNDYVRGQVVATFKKSFVPALQELQVSFKTLADVKFDPLLTMTYKNGLSAELAQLNQHVTESAEAINALESSRNILNDGMKVLEKGNFADVANSTLLTVENVSAMGLAAPEAELVKLAIQHMKQTLEHISGALNYLSMYNERERLVKKINELKPQHEKRVADAAFTDAKIRLLDNIHGLYEDFFSARAEYAKINESVTAFAEHLNVGEPAYYEDRLLSAGPAFIDYVTNAA